jgi:hypothetical protein
MALITENEYIASLRKLNTRTGRQKGNYGEFETIV